MRDADPLLILTVPAEAGMSCAQTTPHGPRLLDKPMKRTTCEITGHSFQIKSNAPARNPMKNIITISISCRL
jgi:hypothetical protein